MRTITNKIDNLKQLNSICFGKKIIDYNLRPRSVSLWLALRAERKRSDKRELAPAARRRSALNQYHKLADRGRGV